MELTKVDLRTLVNDVIESVTPSIDEHNICIQTVMPDYPLWVLGDRERLHQIQVNLLSNAVKYSPHGGVVWFSLSVEDLHAVIRVKDSGIGVPSSLLQKVFDPFVQSDVSLHRSEGGLGLGLTLVKSLVELHRGTVQAKSEGTNLGSEFVVRLPRYIDAPAEMSATKRSIGFLRFDKPSVALNLPHHTPLRPLRIAIVEDQIPNARILKEHLELDGHAVEIAFDGQEGLRLITNDPPDVALLDIGLPGMDGYALAQAIREHLLERSPVLIAITGYGQTADVDHSVESGFSAHLMKPLDLVQLNQVLSAYFPTPAIESPNIV